jgi:histone chaperone ASF1
MVRFFAAARPDILTSCVERDVSPPTQTTTSGAATSAAVPSANDLDVTMDTSEDGSSKMNGIDVSVYK